MTCIISTISMYVKGISALMTFSNYFATNFLNSSPRMAEPGSPIQSSSLFSPAATSMESSRNCKKSSSSSSSSIATFDDSSDDDDFNIPFPLLPLVVVIIFIIFFFLFSTVVAVAVEQQHGFDAALVVVRGAPLCAKADFDEREVEVNIIIIYYYYYYGAKAIK